MATAAPKPKAKRKAKAADGEPAAKRQKKTKETDAIFANVRAARQESGNDPEALEISIDTKAKVNEGDYSRGGKKPDRLGGEDARCVGP